MGGSGEVNCNGVDATVGGLVWVRRRNGSWWPGRIMGSDELPETCLVSLKSGTPVKLLGRDDASVSYRTSNLLLKKNVISIPMSKNLGFLGCICIFCGFSRILSLAQTLTVDLPQENCPENLHFLRFTSRRGKGRTSKIFHGKVFGSPVFTTCPSISPKHSGAESMEFGFHTLSDYGKSSCEFRKLWNAGLHSNVPKKLKLRRDWYNLEKSKRVKAFRCGEYDECIEKAKASIGHSNKRAVKYAHRKDAILHALELENACSGDWEVCVRVGNSAGGKHEHLARQSQTMHRPRDYISKKLFEVNSTQELSLSVLSSEQSNHVTTSQVHVMKQTRQKTLNDSENDDNKETECMQGFQDLGLRVVSKTKPSMHFHTKGSLEVVLPDSVSLGQSNICNSLSSDSPVNSSRGSCSSLKRRCSNVTNVHESFKKKHRPLSELLESTAKVVFPGACDHDAIPGRSSIERVTENRSITLESTESKNTSFSVAISNNSDSTRISVAINNNASEHTCEAAADAIHSEMNDNEFSNVMEFPNNDMSGSFLNMSFDGAENVHGGFSPVLVSYESEKLQSSTLGRQSSHCSQIGSRPLNTEGFDETGSTCFASHGNYSEPRIKSKQELKGFGGKVDNRSFHGSLVLDDCGHLEKWAAVSEDTGDGSLCNIQVSNNLVQKQELGSTEVVFPSVEGRNRLHNSSSYEKPVIGKSTVGARIKESFCTQSLSHCSMPRQGSLFSTFSNHDIAVAPITTLDSSLFDVNLNVHASYQGGRVPLVSLMSKLNGKAIIGHPITVEIMEDGHCDLLMTSINCCPTNGSSNLYDVPIKITSGQMMGVVDSLLMDGSDDGIGALQTATDHLIAKDQRNNLSTSLNRSPSSRKKLPKMRKCAFLYKKTRKLSSIIVDNDRLIDERKIVIEKLGGPIMSCVPLKLVFSRISEALSSSGRRHIIF